MAAKAKDASATTTTEPATNTANARRLGLVFDIDGTLIAEGPHINGMIMRHGTIEFLSWCLDEGHSLALWTAAWPRWADQVASHLCTQVQAWRRHRYQQESNNNKEAMPLHICHSPRDCQLTFQFVWDFRRMTLQEPSMLGPAAFDASEGCTWCDPYGKVCQRCLCWYGGPSLCLCRSVKDLRKVWQNYGRQQDTAATAAAAFCKDSTLMIENTPQQCVRNLGNAIYVPTCRGYHPNDDIWERLQNFLKRLPPDANVRNVVKCRHGTQRHACREQIWWSGSNASFCQEIIAEPDHGRTADPTKGDIGLV